MDLDCIDDYIRNFANSIGFENQNFDQNTDKNSNQNLSRIKEVASLIDFPAELISKNTLADKQNSIAKKIN